MTGLTAPVVEDWTWTGAEWLVRITVVPENGPVVVVLNDEILWEGN